MNKEGMVIGREYVHNDIDGEVYVYKRHSGERDLRGEFKEKGGDDLYGILYSCMTEAPQAKPEFEFDDEIEVSPVADFSFSWKGKFKHLDPSGPYWVVDEDGHMRCGKFARKVEPMITVYFDDLSGMIVKDCLIPKSLADKIKAGDFNV